MHNFKLDQFQSCITWTLMDPLHHFHPQHLWQLHNKIWLPGRFDIQIYSDDTKVIIENNKIDFDTVFWIRLLPHYKGSVCSIKDAKWLFM